MNNQIEVLPKQRRGCFAKGCLILMALGILLIVGGIGGAFFSFRKIYLSDKPASIPEASVPGETSAATNSQATAAARRETNTTVRERLDAFKSAAQAHEETGMELTAEDINRLIAANRKSRGTAFVRIDDNVARIQLSIPLKRLDLRFQNVLGLGDQYLNGNVTVVAPPGTNASNVQLSELTINGHSIPSDLLDWGVPGVGKTLRSYVIKYANKYGVRSGEIRDGKVILYTSGY